MTYRGHLYTVWTEELNKTEEQVVEIFNKCIEDGLIKYYCFQEEVAPDTLRHHLQLFIEWRQPQRGERIERLLGIGKRQYHGVRRRGTAEDCSDYCSKEDTRVAGPWSGGTLDKRPGTRSDLQRIADRVTEGSDIRSIAREFNAGFIRYGRGIRDLQNVLFEPSTEFKKKEVLILVGPPGCGKTRWVIENYGQSLWKAPASFGSKQLWFDGYRGQETVFFDDFTGNCDYETILRLTHDWEETVPVKGGFCRWWPKRIIFASNVPVECWWPTRGEIGAFERRVTQRVNFDRGGEENMEIENVTVTEVGGGNTNPPQRDMDEHSDTSNFEWLNVLDN